MRLTLLLLIPLTTQAQWTLQPSGTTASLRGIHALSDQIAWASGSSGTVLHTTDGGTHWLPCATPPQAERLDFRGIQAFDAQTAIVMSSGKGDLSRLYKTTDACQSWTLLFTNPDKEGFWDAIEFDSPKTGMVIGDPVKDKFPTFTSIDGGSSWNRGDAFATYKGIKTPTSNGLSPSSRLATPRSSSIEAQDPTPCCRWSSSPAEAAVHCTTFSSSISRSP